MNLATLLLLTLSTLVLRTGERIDVQGSIREQDGQLIFRAAGGALYSIPLAEIDREATQAASEEQAEAAPESRKLRVSPEERDRLLRELEKNHAGKPAPAQRMLEEPPPAPSREEAAAERTSEWEWRRIARGHEESIRQARENLELLFDRAERLQGEIRGLLALGFKPQQFTYQTTLLYYTLEQIPYAEVSVTRAQRSWDQFREDARRQGVLPGWLR